MMPHENMGWKASDGLIALIKTEPRTKPQLAVDNTKATPRRSWVAEKLTKAGQTS